MTRPITRNGLIRIAVITAVGLAILPFTPGAKQGWNLRRAASHADKLRPILQTDQRFQHVRAGVHTSNGGSLMLQGSVACEKDKIALAKLVADSKPPVPVTFMILKPQPHEIQKGTDQLPTTIHADRD